MYLPYYVASPTSWCKYYMAALSMEPIGCLLTWRKQFGSSFGNAGEKVRPEARAVSSKD